jgi:hypothetical protein
MKPGHATLIIWSNNQSRSEGANSRDMQARLRKWYGVVAQANHASVVPVGDAWNTPTRRLIRPDSTPVIIHTPSMRVVTSLG